MQRHAYAYMQRCIVTHSANSQQTLSEMFNESTATPHTPRPHDDKFQLSEIVDCVLPLMTR